MNTSSYYYQNIETTETKIVHVNIDTANENVFNRPPVDLIVVVDRSGSMAGTRIRMVKDTIDFIIANLNEYDRLAIVTYSDEVRIKLELTYLTNLNKAKASRMSESINAQSYTFLSGGLYTGIEHMLRNGRADAVQSIIMLTDGQGNKGDRDDVIPGKVADLIERSPVPVSIHTFGYGSDHNENLLSAIARITGGMYFYIQNIEDIGTAFANCIGGIFSVFGVRVEIIIQLLNSCRITRVFGYTFEQDEDRILIKLPELQREERKDILIECQCNDPKSDINIQLSFDDYSTGSKEHFNIPVEQGRGTNYGDQYCRELVIQALFNACDNRDSASEIISSASSEIEALQFRSPFINSLLEELGEIQGYLNTRRDVFMLIIQHAMAHKYQRSSGIESSSHSGYSTPARRHMQESFRNREFHKYCHNCGSNQHFAKDCATEEMCHNCKGTGHQVQNCPQGEKCHRCGETGHKKFECTNNSSRRGDKSGTKGGKGNTKRGDNGGNRGGRGNARGSKSGCFKCGSNSHWSKECPN